MKLPLLFVFVAQQLMLAMAALASLAMISPKSDNMYSKTKTNPRPCGNTSKRLTTYSLSKTWNKRKKLIYKVFKFDVTFREIFRRVHGYTLVPEPNYI